MSITKNTVTIKVIKKGARECNSIGVPFKGNAKIITDYDSSNDTTIVQIIVPEDTKIIYRL